MKRLLLRAIGCIFVLNSQILLANEPMGTAGASMPNDALICAAFSPYVGELNPAYGPQPSEELIDTLLDRLIDKTPFRCIMTYGVMDGLEHIFAAAEARQLKVISIIWLDKDVEMNSRSIASGIRVAKAYPATIKRTMAKFCVV